MLDDGSRILSWNTAAEELFGISAEAALGRPAGSVFPEFGVLVERVRRRASLRSASAARSAGSRSRSAASTGAAW